MKTALRVLLVVLAMAWLVAPFVGKSSRNEFIQSAYGGHLDRNGDTGKVERLSASR